MYVTLLLFNVVYALLVYLEILAKSYVVNHLNSQNRYSVEENNFKSSWHVYFQSILPHAFHSAYKELSN